MKAVRISGGIILLIGIICLHSCRSTKTVSAAKLDVKVSKAQPASNFIDSLKNGKIFYSLGGLDYTDELYNNIPEVFKIVFPNVMYFKHTVLTMPETIAIAAVYDNIKYNLSGDFNLLYKQVHVDSPHEKRILALIYVMEDIVNKKIEIKSINQVQRKIERTLQYTEFNYEIVAKVNNDTFTYYLLFKDNKVYCLVKTINHEYRTAIMPNI
jgi:hypothetical protein